MSNKTKQSKDKDESKYKMELIRFGWGSRFNRLFVDKEVGVITKQSSDPRIHREIRFYQWIQRDPRVSALFPKLIQVQRDGYRMEYLDGYRPLFDVYPTLTDPEKIRVKEQIQSGLDLLHNLDRHFVDQDTWTRSLIAETRTKIGSRFYTADPKEIERFQRVNVVNGVPVREYEVIVELLCNRLAKLAKEKQECFFVPIHGDPQFNNILIDPTQLKQGIMDLRFIDPRACFSDLPTPFGIREYDQAKVLFALSGYDHFDNTKDPEIHWEDDWEKSVRIPLTALDETIYDTADPFELLLMATIWCANFAIFQDERKRFASFSLARWIGERVLKSIEFS